MVVAMYQVIFVASTNTSFFNYYQQYISHILKIKNANTNVDQLSNAQNCFFLYTMQDATGKVSKWELLEPLPEERSLASLEKGKDERERSKVDRTAAITIRRSSPCRWQERFELGIVRQAGRPALLFSGDGDAPAADANLPGLSPICRGRVRDIAEIFLDTPYPRYALLSF